MRTSSCPLDARKAVDVYFMEHRAKLLDIAAFLDRLDRAAGEAAGDDVRIRALRLAVPLLIDGEGQRVRRILELFSDHTSEPIPVAHGQGAIGVDPRGSF